ncbi:MAG: hypothetical protein H0V66_11725 [Bdellovibrionales bacterium]|nr:hypothetical protein [Bdellovibrionales bacterium]
MDQSNSFRIIVLGQDSFFVEEVISIIGIRYSGVGVDLKNFTDVENHFLHSMPPDGVIVQTGHPAYNEIHEFIRKHQLNILLISFSPKDFIAKIDAYFAALASWFSVVPFLPLNSNLAGFIGYTPVDLFVKEGTEYRLMIKKKSFISEDNVKSFFQKGDGFFFIRREDRAEYGEDWEESTLAYFKSDVSVTITKNGPMGVIIPFLESTSYHSISEADQYLLFSALERITYLLQEHSELSDAIESILKKNSYQLKHTTFLMCMNIATMSALGIGSSLVFFNITLAALVHDLGTLSYGFEEYEFHDFAMEKMLDESSISKYSRHGEASLSLLVKHQVCPRWVAEMVLSHHENDNGFGYPLGINSSSLGLATFIFAFNHEWSEKVYGFMAKNKSKIDLETFLNFMPAGSEKAKNLKVKILKHLQFTLR